ncbi:hypothetical protein Nmel_013439 [Mimus melanotis]
MAVSSASDQKVSAIYCEETFTTGSWQDNMIPRYKRIFAITL